MPLARRQPCWPAPKRMARGLSKTITTASFLLRPANRWPRLRGWPTARGDLSGDLIQVMCRPCAWRIWSCQKPDRRFRRASWHLAREGITTRRRRALADFISSGELAAYPPMRRAIAKPSAGAARQAVTQTAGRGAAAVRQGGQHYMCWRAAGGDRRCGAGAARLAGATTGAATPYPTTACARQRRAKLVIAVRRGGRKRHGAGGGAHGAAAGGCGEPAHHTQRRCAWPGPQ